MKNSNDRNVFCDSDPFCLSGQVEGKEHIAVACHRWQALWQIERSRCIMLHFPRKVSKLWRKDRLPSLRGRARSNKTGKSLHHYSWKHAAELFKLQGQVLSNSILLDFMHSPTHQWRSGVQVQSAYCLLPHWLYWWWASYPSGAFGMNRNMNRYFDPTSVVDLTEALVAEWEKIQTGNLRI